MADIFISSSRLDQDRVKPIADRLSSLGYSVWWERPPRTGHAAIEEGASQLDTAKAVLTIWSANARNSSLVCAESAKAFDEGRLVQLRLDNVTTPSPFAALPIADMRGAGEWGVLEDSLARRVRGGDESQEPDTSRALPTPAAGGVPKILTVAIFAALLAFVGALSAALNGAMSSAQLQIAATGILVIGLICAAISGFRLITVLRAGG